jgi:glycosyltransferase involved in cell wall biosynthesis
LEAALHYGLPVVLTSRKTGAPDGAVTVVPRRDPRAIAAALRAIASDPKLRERRAPDAQGRQRRAPVEAHVAALERLYRGVLTGTR